MPGGPNDLISVSRTFMSSSAEEIASLKVGEIAFDGTNLVGRDETGIVTLRLGAGAPGTTRGSTAYYTSNSTLSRSTLGSATRMSIVCVSGGGGGGASTKRSGRTRSGSGPLYTYVGYTTAACGGGGGGGTFVISENLSVSTVFGSESSLSILVGGGGSGAFAIGAIGGSGGGTSVQTLSGASTIVSAPIGGGGGGGGRCNHSSTSSAPTATAGAAGAGSPANGTAGATRVNSSSSSSLSTVAPPSLTVTNNGNTPGGTGSRNGAGSAGGNIGGTSTTASPTLAGRLSAGSFGRGGAGGSVTSTTALTIPSGATTGTETFQQGGSSGTGGFVFIWWW